MGSRVRQVSQLLGLATATAFCALLSGAEPTSTPNVMPPLRLGPSQPEFRLIRLAYDDNAMGYGGFGRRGRSWTTDAPEAEFHLTQGIRRLTRIDTFDPGSEPDWNSDVYPLAPLDDELFSHPFLYAVEVGRWYLDDEQAARIRDYLLRGGFLMVDDFHGTLQWEGFMESMRRIFPDRDVVEIPDGHEVFHVIWDLEQVVGSGHKIQIPGLAALYNGVTYEQDGVEPHWRGVFDDNGRLMVAINFNMDLGDAWEQADNPSYPEKYTALAYRIGTSYAIYAMTH
jgi:hypothetical protein